MTFVHCYLPGFRWGGQLRTVANIVSHLGKEFEFKIVTSDRDVGDDNPFPNIVTKSWTSVGLAQVWYSPESHLSLRHFLHLMRTTNFDILYLNSVFDYRFTILPLVAVRILHDRFSSVPVIVASRGEFAPDALRIRWFKKRVFILLSKMFGLYRNVTWHASSSYEAVDIKRVMGAATNRIHIAPNLPEVWDQIETEDSSAETRSDGARKLRMVFLSRISEIKNLDYALRVLSRVTTDVSFDIYGDAVDFSYKDKCIALASALPPNIQVNFLGPVTHEEVRITLSRYDLFFLPTKGENYGHVIVEALSTGVPVLISDRTPWRDLESKGIGWAISLGDDDSFVRAIEAYASETKESRDYKRKKAVEYARRIMNDPETLKANRRLFSDRHSV